MLARLTPAAAFEALGLPRPVCTALAATGFETPLPIQTDAIPPVLAGRDVVATAETGSGKTLAYLAPILARLAATRREHGPRALVLAPTRELAQQIGSVAASLGDELRLACHVIHGGVGFSRQEGAFQAEVPLIIATPGRLRDLVQRGTAELDTISMVVLDEADRMLEMGFVEDVRHLLGHTSPERQTVLCSATLDKRVEEFVRGSLEDPVRVAASTGGDRPIPAGIVHELAEVRIPFKRMLLVHALADPSWKAVLVFVKTRFRCQELARVLEEDGVQAAPLHAHLSQTARNETLARFRAGDLRVLVATDLAERGLDIPLLTHVVNFDPPNTPEIYLHRVGRTARAFGEGTAVSLVASAERAEVEKAGVSLGVEFVERKFEGFDYDQRPQGIDPLVDRRAPRRKGRREGAAEARREPPGPRRARGWKGDQPAGKAEFWEQVRKKRKKRK